MAKKAEIGVFGGSGFYSYLKEVEEIKVETLFGPPSAKVTVGEVEGRKVAFLPRHGVEHQFPAHMINYRANVWAMKELGVSQIIGPCACGSLQPHIKPGDFVICDQFVDRTCGRKDTYYDGPVATHITGAEPYCPTLRKLSFETAKELGISVHDKGTVVIIQGPRFSTKAESKWFSKVGFEVVNMTQYPEAVLARELEICYVNISLVTDYDVGLEGHPDIKPVTAQEIAKTFNANNENIKQLLTHLIPKMPTERNCLCKTALASARF